MSNVDFLWLFYLFWKREGTQHLSWKVRRSSLCPSCFDTCHFVYMGLEQHTYKREKASKCNIIRVYALDYDTKWLSQYNWTHNFIGIKSLNHIPITTVQSFWKSTHHVILDVFSSEILIQHHTLEEGRVLVFYQCTSHHLLLCSYFALGFQLLSFIPSVLCFFRNEGYF